MTDGRDEAPRGRGSGAVPLPAEARLALRDAIGAYAAPLSLVALAALEPDEEWSAAFRSSVPSGRHLSPDDARRLARLVAAASDAALVRAEAAILEELARAAAAFDGEPGVARPGEGRGEGRGDGRAAPAEGAMRTISR